MLWILPAHIAYRMNLGNLGKKPDTLVSFSLSMVQGLGWRSQA